MPPTPEKTPIRPKEVYRLAIELFQDYFKTIFGTQLLAIFAASVIIIVSLLLTGTLVDIITDFDFMAISTVFADILTLMSLFPGLFVFLALLGSLFGMMQEVLKGGDYYVELKSAFFYFKRHWWGYSALALLFLTFTFLIQSVIPPEDVLPLLSFGRIGLSIFVSLCTYLCLSVFGLAPALLTDGKRIWPSIQGAFRLFRRHGKFIAVTVAGAYWPLQIALFFLGDVAGAFISGEIAALIYFFIWVVVFLFQFFAYFPWFIIVISVVYRHLLAQSQEKEASK